MENYAIGGYFLYVNSLLFSRYNKFFFNNGKNVINNYYTPERIIKITSKVFN